MSGRRCEERVLGRGSGWIFLLEGLMGVHGSLEWFVGRNINSFVT